MKPKKGGKDNNRPWTSNERRCFEQSLSGYKIIKNLSSDLFYWKKLLEFKLLNKECLLIERAVTLTIQLFYDEGMFDSYDHAGQVIKDYLLIEVLNRRKPDLDEISDVIQWFCS